jgi:putative pyruvate formate lyase activating enzyme
MAEVAAVVPHFGEEPPLTATGGAGTVFLSHCNLRCAYCQNFQISQQRLGHAISPTELAQAFLRLEAAGCANIEAVSPGHHLPGLLEALAIAVERGLSLPFVYNSNGYEAPEALELLDGIVDLYLPDLKYASDAAAATYSDAVDYVSNARSAILTMYEQVGNLVVDMHGRGLRGLIVRHLILPGGASGTEETLEWLRMNLPRTVTLSLMAQFDPLHRSREFPEINRRITPDEYDAVIDLAWDLGFENVFIQDLDSPCIGVPDFKLDQPFDWGR